MSGGGPDDLQIAAQLATGVALTTLTVFALWWLAANLPAAIRAEWRRWQK